MPKPSPRALRLSISMTEAWTSAVTKGRRRPAADFPFKVLPAEALDLLRPDGTLIAALRPRAVPPAVCCYSRSAVRAAASHHSDHRGGHESGTVGFWRGRPAAWTQQHPGEWCRLQILLRELDRVFREEFPTYYAARAEAVRVCNFLIPGTTFTTATANRNAQFHVHRDRRNLAAGLEVMTVLRGGEYTGGYLAFPRYLTAFDLRSGDVLLADFRGELHCNTPLVGTPGAYERLSVIAYARAELVRGRNQLPTA